MSSFLPHGDSCIFSRELQLEVSRLRYKYNHAYLNPLALVDHVPLCDEPSLKWLQAVADRALHIFCNMETYVGDQAELKAVSEEAKLVHRLAAQGAAAIKEVALVISKGVNALANIDDESIRPTSLDDYSKLFAELQIPPIHKDYKQDAVFANMRLAGPNPVMIEQILTPPRHFPVTEAHFRASMPDDSMEAAGKEGRLYLADYVQLATHQAGFIPRSKGKNEQKYVYAPLALFAVHKTTGDFLPIAIQCQQTPAEDNPVFTPKDGSSWLIAKTTVEIADGCIHEPCTHLGRTHFYLDPFCVAMHRQLAHRHPLYRLLSPHFEGTLFINYQAHAHLVSEGGPVDLLISQTIGESLDDAARSVETYHFDDQLLPKALKNRRVDTSTLPNYAYRDDALLYWDAIHQWVSDYVGIYYKTDADVVKDDELQSFIREATSKEGGRINGMSEMKSVSYLNDVMTMLIYTGSVQHAAVNFPQWNYMSYMPNMSLGGYSPAPTSADATEQDYLNMLPPMDMSELQMNVAYLLGTIHYTELSKYADNQFPAEAGDALKKFQARIEDIGNTIQQRNENRIPYPILLPNGIPQSINI